jgi:hypothetical protein
VRQRRASSSFCLEISKGKTGKANEQRQHTSNCIKQYGILFLSNCTLI